MLYAVIFSTGFLVGGLAAIVYVALVADRDAGSEW